MTLASEHGLCGHGRGREIDVWRAGIDVRDGASRLNGGKPGVGNGSMVRLIQFHAGSTGQRGCVEFHTIYFVPAKITYETSVGRIALDASDLDAARLTG